MSGKTPSRLPDLAEAQEALRASEAEYREIVETTSDGIIKCDVTGVLLFVNRRCLELLGYQHGEMIGRNLLDFMNSADREDAVRAQARRRQGIRDVLETRLIHKNGSEIAVAISGAPIVDREGRFIGTQGMVRDVTEQRKLQSQLIASDRMASVGTLAAGVAHEINNPLAAVIASLDYISEGLIQDELRAPLADAREAAERVRLIVRDLKIFSRSPEDRPRSVANVEVILETSLRMGWNEIRHRARLVKDFVGVPAVRADEARLGQVFLNLIINAAQAIPDGHAENNEIRVTTRLADARVIVEVSDTGAGIPAAIIDRIFDAFFTTKGVGVGTGLGLAISQRIVTDMGGELTVRSQQGKGTTFRVSLPVVDDEDRGALVERARAPIAGRRGRVLVVDDEEMLLRAVKRVLAADHDVVTRASARDALALCIAGETFDLILCDLMMPDMTGMDLHRELSRLAPSQADRMLFLTGGAFTPQARAFLSEVAREHLEKPFDASNLRAIAQRYLR
jgi:PAS domain S-box-containing protein